ncbi:helix-turn-helix domain-containing protein [Parablautia muri]|uniref:XRE family transcriptional regulator n=1 Tax=Parablautia muri TaxID=2320879 RepID=A0A9X5GTA0_9FIRM|nr:helix-turn-helix transcriptional regulator [Parablautia muri]NBJ92772.1 XRE family transcriptional regulator [Parablautia muri]
MKNFEEVRNFGKQDFEETTLFQKSQEKEDCEKMKGDMTGLDKSNSGKMNLAENLQYLRKQRDITQEQLAERLEVSRQSVSKWESGQSYPEMEKLLQICGMFHCNLDTLMRGDISSIFAQDVHGYDKFQSKFNKLVAGGVGLILLGISVMLMLSGIGMDEMLSGAVFFTFLIAAVMIFVVMGLQKERFCQKHPVIEDFYTEEEKEHAYRSFTVRMATGIGTILTAFLFSMVVDARLENIPDAALAERGDELLGSFFMLMIAAGVTILVYGTLDRAKYNIKGYNVEANPSVEKKKRDALIGKLCACIMMVAAIAYLLLNFTIDFSMSWITFAVGGILCGIVAVALSKEK